MENLIIREAEPEDAEALLAYLNQIGGESDNLLFGENEFTMSVEQEKEFLDSFKNADKSIMLLGIWDGEIAACASLQNLQKKRIAHRASMAISVKKQYWHRGIASEMVGTLIDFAKKAGISVIELEVKSDNVHAVSLYEKMGFEKIGTYRKFFYIDGVYYDAYLMNLYLDSVGDRR